MTLPGWLRRSVVSLAVFAAVLALATAMRRGAEPPAPPAVGLPETPDYHGLLVAREDARRLWLGTHMGLYESRDGGRSWKVAGLEGRDAMNIVATEPGTLWVAGHYVLARSTDGGATWSDVRPGGLPGLDVHAFAADPTDPDRLYAAVAGEGLFRSEDGGTRFALVSRDVGADVGALAVTPSGRILAGDASRGVLASDDGGRTWRGLLARPVRGVAVSPRDPRTLLASGSGVFLSRDAGRTWKEVLPANRSTWGVGWSSAAPRTAYVVALPPVRTLYRSDDAGASWEAVTERRG